MAAVFAFSAGVNANTQQNSTPEPVGEGPASETTAGTRTATSRGDGQA
jgi:hypothetical protein